MAVSTQVQNCAQGRDVQGARCCQNRGAHSHWASARAVAVVQSPPAHLRPLHPSSQGPPSMRQEGQCVQAEAPPFRHRHRADAPGVGHPGELRARAAWSWVRGGIEPQAPVCARLHKLADWDSPSHLTWPWASPSLGPGEAPGGIAGEPHFRTFSLLWAPAQPACHHQGPHVPAKAFRGKRNHREQPHVPCSPHLPLCSPGSAWPPR